MSLPRKAVGEWELRRRFNKEVLPRADNGELLVLVSSERHPTAPLAQEPFCTRSQMLTYYETTHGTLVEIARAHQYLRPDDTLGLSGKPDPKRVVDDGVLYWYRSKQNQQPPPTAP